MRRRRKSRSRRNPSPKSSGMIIGILAVAGIGLYFIMKKKPTTTIAPVIVPGQNANQTLQSQALNAIVSSGAISSAASALSNLFSSSDDET